MGRGLSRQYVAVPNVGWLSERTVADQQQVTIAPTTDEGRALATITVAFSSDPVVRWFMRDADQYLRFWPPFVMAFAGAGFAAGTIDTVEDHCGVGMWLPPGEGSDEEAIGAVVAEAIPASQRDEVDELFEQMGDHHPVDPHWYLPLIGVDTSAQNRGYGSALLAHALERCDRDRMPAYLEATSQKNRALYARHGFEEIGRIQAGSAPPMWPMWREPPGG